MTDHALSDRTYADFFGQRDTNSPEDDFEFLTILGRLSFGEGPGWFHGHCAAATH